MVQSLGQEFFLVLVQKNAVNKSVNSAALYADLEYEITDKWMVNGAVRFENYSDWEYFKI
jgi:iron complex outermembrane receptor protein